MNADDSTDERSLQTKLLWAVVALLVDRREASDDSQPQKIEVLLADAGLSSIEIAALVRKNRAAVRKTLSRARLSTTEGND